MVAFKEQGACPAPPPHLLSISAPDVENQTRDPPLHASAVPHVLHYTYITNTHPFLKTPCKTPCKNNIYTH